MNVIVVDDEILALELCEEAIMKALPSCSLYCFDNPSEALEHAEKTRVDIAFLDIEMSGMNGLQLAKCLKEIYSRTNIIFVSGNPQYAADAFTIHASGYLLKPVTAAAVLESIEFLWHPVASSPDIQGHAGMPLHTGTPLHVRAFGNFEVFLSGKPFHFSRSKSKEIFAYLVYKNGASCTVRELAAVLEDSSEKNMQTYISAMMKDLAAAGQGGVIIKSYNSIAVDTSAFDCDYYRFLKGDAGAVNSYMGEFMMQYSWAEFVTGYLDGKIQW